MLRYGYLTVTFPALLVQQWHHPNILMMAGGLICAFKAKGEQELGSWLPS